MVESLQLQALKPAITKRDPEYTLKLATAPDIRKHKHRYIHVSVLGMNCILYNSSTIFDV